jgi:hypothetical protein
VVSADEYIELRAQLGDLGYGEEIEWSRSVPQVSDPLMFWSEYAWVVLNSGMRNQVAAGIWARVRPCVVAGGSAGDVFGHKGKSAGIDHVYAHRERLLTDYLAAENKVDWLGELPWIGDITKWHLAKNYGHDCAKPDRHLVRVAGAEGVDEMCARWSRQCGDRVATVDMVVWRAANLGLL